MFKKQAAKKSQPKPKKHDPLDPLLTELATLSAVIEHGFQEVIDLLSSRLPAPPEEEPDTPDEAA